MNSFLVLFCIGISKFKISTAMTLGILFYPSALAAIICYNLKNKFMTYIDLFADIAGFTVGSVILIIGLIRMYKATKHKLNINLIDTDRFLLLRKSLVLGVLVIQVCLNIFDIFALNNAIFKDVVDWKVSFFFPVLIVATLIDIGSYKSKIVETAEELSEKKIIDKELLEGKAMQLDTLPPRKGSFGGWKWRAFYRPLSKVAGDSFDIQTLTFPDGKQLIAGLVIDITGHGVRAAMATGVGTCLFRTWSKQLLSDANFPNWGSSRLAA